MTKQKAKATQYDRRSIGMQVRLWNVLDEMARLQGRKRSQMVAVLVQDAENRQRLAQQASQEAKNVGV